MTTPDEVKQAAREPTDAELAAILRKESISPGCMTEDDFEIAARRLEASPSTDSTSAHHTQGEISEAMVKRAAMALCPYPEIAARCPDRPCNWCKRRGRAALEAAISGEKDGR